MPLIVSVCSGLLSMTAMAKPDNVDGVNVPPGRIPQEIKDNKYPRTYYPNTEKLGKAEMRITALGTGMPNQSPSNVATSFLVELGNGESFGLMTDWLQKGELEGMNPPPTQSID